jgi:hypothetical protein
MDSQKIEEKKIAEIEVIDVEIVTKKVKKCNPGEACQPGDFFEMITTCEICSKLF